MRFSLDSLAIYLTFLQRSGRLLTTAAPPSGPHGTCPATTSSAALLPHALPRRQLPGGIALATGKRGGDADFEVPTVRLPLPLCRSLSSGSAPVPLHRPRRDSGKRC